LPYAYPLVKALIDKDSRVRYHAAIALVHLNPPQQFMGATRVAATLAQALAESGQRTILVVDRDAQNRNKVTSMLRRMRYNVTTAATPTEGLMKAKRFPGPDLILIYNRDASWLTFLVTVDPEKPVRETVIDTLRADVRTKTIPIVIMADPAELNKAREAFGTKVDGYITRPPAKSALSDTLQEIFNRPELQQTAKARAERIAQRAAEALAMIDPELSVFRYTDAIGALIKAAQERNDPIALPSLKALKRYGDDTCILPLAKILSDEEGKYSKKVRIAAGEALGHIFRRTGTAPTAEVFTMLKQVLQEKDFQLQRAAARALCGAALTAEQRKELAELKRVHK
jgi:CheY-like chemotaxis protein